MKNQNAQHAIAPPGIFFERNLDSKAESSSETDRIDSFRLEENEPENIFLSPKNHTDDQAKSEFVFHRGSSGLFPVVGQDEYFTLGEEDPANNLYEPNYDSMIARGQFNNTK